MSTHEDFEQWMAEQSGWNPYPDLREAWQAATALRDAEIAQLKAERDAFTQAAEDAQAERDAARDERDALLLALRRAVLALAFAAESSPAMRDDYEAVSAAIAKVTP